MPARAHRRFGRYGPVAVAAAVLLILTGVLFGSPADRLSLYRLTIDAAGNRNWEFLNLVRDPTGTMLLVVDPGGQAHRIDIASRRVETMPFPGGVPNAFTW
jgi:hypothetical protein